MPRYARNARHDTDRLSATSVWHQRFLFLKIAQFSLNIHYYRNLRQPRHGLATVNHLALTQQTTTYITSKHRPRLRCRLYHDMGVDKACTREVQSSSELTRLQQRQPQQQHNNTNNSNTTEPALLAKSWSRTSIPEVAFGKPFGRRSLGRR